MRLLSGGVATGGGTSGVIAGVYPTPIIEKYIKARGFAVWGGLQSTEGVLIPDNYNDAASQSNIDSTYADVNDSYPLTTGPVANGEELRYLAETFVNYDRGKILRLAPYAQIVIDDDGVPPSSASGTRFKFCATDTNKFIYGWVGNVSGNSRLHIRVADRTTGRIVWGDVQEVAGVNLGDVQYNNWDIQQLATDKFIIIFYDSDNSDRLSAVAITLDASDLIDTVGTILEVSTESNQAIICTEFAATDKVVMEWDDAQTVVAISASGTTLTAGTPVDITGSAAAGSLASFRYAADDSLVAVIQNTNASGDMFCRMLSLIGTAITAEAENVRNTGGGTANNVLTMGTTSATNAHVQILFSSSYDVWLVDISGTTATWNGASSDIAIGSNDRMQVNRNDSAVYIIDSLNEIIEKYDTDQILLDSFEATENIPVPINPSNDGSHNSTRRDLRDGFSLMTTFSNPFFTAIMVSPDVDVDIEFNGVNVHASGTPTFGLVANVDSNIDAPSVEIGITNQAGGLRGFQPDQFISTVT